MPEVQWRQFGDYSGPLVVGTDVIPIPISNISAEKFYWLTTKVETNGTFGTVVMFDGTALTAGPDQFIIVYPKELANEDFNAADDQGPLGPLLARVLAVSTSSYAVEVKRGFAAQGWVLTPTGQLKYVDSRSVRIAGRAVQVKAGGIVHGALIRDTFTPIGGKVPRTGSQWEQASTWAFRFNRVFADPATFSTQRLYGLEHMERSFQSRRVTVAGKPLTIEKVLGVDFSTATLEKDLELAFAVWYSNSVNAPAIALQCLQNALNAVSGDLNKLPKVLLRMLGSSNFGRWNANISGGRWQRTRKAAMESGLWAAELFQGVGAIMPVRM